MERELKDRQDALERAVEQLLDEAIRGVVLQQQKYVLSDAETRRMLVRLCQQALRAGVGEARLRNVLARWGFAGILEWTFTRLEEEG